MEIADTIFVVIVIIFSAVIHEVMHGVAADRLGDPTARYAGRLTLNPIPHLDLWGSLIIPGMLALTQSPIFFGWAKPVPYNPYNLRPGRFSEAIVAGAGPLSNLVIALIVGLILRANVVSPLAGELLFVVVAVNTMLFLFNLIPVPPLDGSKIIESLLPEPLKRGYGAWRARFEMNPILGLGLVLLIVVLFGRAFGGFVFDIARAIAGI
jgi:Zn-dependent protease